MTGRKRGALDAIFLCENLSLAFGYMKGCAPILGILRGKERGGATLGGDLSEGVVCRSRGYKVLFSQMKYVNVFALH